MPSRVTNPTSISRGEASQADQSHVERAHRHIQARIADFSLRPGESATDASIAAELGMSRTPVREALRRLEREGLVSHTPHRGWKVRTLRVSDIEEIFELKECLEAILIRQAAERMTKPLAEALRAITTRMEVAALRMDRQDWLTADGAWHDTFYAAASNARARQIVSSVNAQWRCMQAGLFATEERMSRSTTEHRVILDRVLSGDANDAARLLQEQIGRTRQYLVTLLRDFIIPFTGAPEGR
jgi:DNA-binding GntR family transcriptional regulator